VYAAVSREWEGKGGVFMDDCDESYAEERRPYGGPKRMEGYIFDGNKGMRLWRDGCEMVGVKDDDA
jgi:hypothetical protein